MRPAATCTPSCTPPRTSRAASKRHHPPPSFDHATAETVPATITGVLTGDSSVPGSGLPDDVYLDQTADGFAYDACAPLASPSCVTDSRIPHIQFSARHLPGGNPGDSLDGGVHNIDALINGAPTHFFLAKGVTSQGVDNATGGFDYLFVHLWDHDTGDPVMLSIYHNFVLVDARNSRLDVQARVEHLSQALLSRPFGITQLETGFSTAPTGVDFQYSYGTDIAPTDRPTDGSCDAPKPLADCTDPAFLSTTLKPAAGDTTVPATAKLQLLTGNGLHVVWTASKTSTLYINKLQTQKFSIASGSDVRPGMTINLPANAEICIAKETFCNPQHYLPSLYMPYQLVALHDRR